MAPFSIGFGIALIVLGVAGYFGTDRVSVTALFPAAEGVLLLVLGLLALKDNLRKHAMHLAAALGLLSFLLAGIRACMKLPALWGDEAGPRYAVLETLLMALISAVFVGLCVRSFINARRARARRALEEAQSPAG